MLDGIETGASVAHNGCCLTVTEINGNQISFDLMKETLRITNGRTGGGRYRKRRACGEVQR